MTNTNYLPATVKQFEYYKQLGEKAMQQVTDKQLFHTPDVLNNSMAIIVQHLWGNMRSRWTDFRHSDGEKTWRNRDEEFEDTITTPQELWQKWEEGWAVLFEALQGIQEEELAELVYIRQQGHTIIEAINRQLAHYAYHIGQLVLLAKLARGTKWQTLSIAKGQSKAYNKQKFQQDKHRGHFTDEFLQ
ncbi:MAG: DUF1572 family protein [Aureispira sp.]